MSAHATHSVVGTGEPFGLAGYVRASRIPRPPSTSAPTNTRFSAAIPRSPYHGSQNTQRLALHDVGHQAEGDALSEVNSRTRESVADGITLSHDRVRVRVVHLLRLDHLHD
jgi:hypothetical protein